ncbi:tetratricopeptide repeat protein [uncultured Algoriphagus sp.]|uniref:tetratricopeptide repeat protein n=1 Tax=uncultured Algoriphagus sp. TaxID=417365 RepID=UPI002582EA9B|nr:tetratricopeptide repeat protein [uncultured Algoriphagus sp.]
MQFKIKHFLVWIFLLPSTYSLGQENQSGLEEIKTLAEKDPKEAFQRLQEFESKLSQSEEAEAVFLEGQLLMEFGLYNEATHKLYQAEELFKKRNCKTCLAHLYNQLGKLYYKTKSTTEALERHNQALQLFEEMGDIKGVARSKGLIGSMFEKLENYSQALAFQNEAIRLSQDINDSSELSILFENVGSIYEDLEEYDSAEHYFQLAFALNSELGNILHMPGNINNLGDTRRKTNRAEESIPFYESALKISQEIGNTYLERSATVDLGKAYADLGEFEKAYQLFSEARELSENIFSEEAARQLASQEFQYEIKQKQLEIAQLENIHIFESRVRWLLVSLILTLLGLGWVLISRQRLKITATKTTLKKQEELIEIKERLIQTEKENINLLEARMSAEVGAQQKALTAQTLHVIEKNQMLKEIQSKLEDILQKDLKEQKKRLRNLIKQIAFNLSQDQDWEEFKHTFENVHQDFIKNLKTENPDLTPGDVKLACLMKMNLSSKEIAATLGISMESLRISRYRLRKRLQLSEGKELHNYLHCL